MYITKASHFKGALDDPLAPKPAREVAQFFFALISEGINAQPGRIIVSKVPCMAGPRPRKFCLGILKLSRMEAPPEIRWECPDCGKAGSISDW